MNETAPTNETSQDAAEAAKNISTLSDYEKVREALVTDSAEARAGNDQLPFEREPMPSEIEETSDTDLAAADAPSDEAKGGKAPREAKARPRSNKAQKVKDRIDRVVWEREEARKEVSQLRHQLEALKPAPAADPSPATAAPTRPEAQAQAPNGSPSAPASDDEPVEASYSDYGEFVTAKARWAARQELSVAIQAAHQHEQQTAQQQQQQHRADAFAKKMESGMPNDPEFLSTIQPEILNLRPAMSLQKGEVPTGATAIADLLMDSDHPHSLMSYLSSHEDDFRRISALHPMLAMRELGRIEVGLDAAPNGSASPPVSSQAQPPIKPVGSSSARTAATDRSPSDINSVAEWEIARKRLLHER
jgi:hypothetical protein